MTKLKCCFVSDTHNKHDDIDPNSFDNDIDILIHCGDLTRKGDPEDVESFAKWYRKIPAKKKFVIAGNHDFCFETTKGLESNREYIINMLQNKSGAKYLQDESAEAFGVKLYGSPWQPEFSSWAFNKPRNGYSLRAKWREIPDDTDILITHGPPHGILDTTYFTHEFAGCEQLRLRVNVVKPAIHAFGHIHEAYGTFTCEYTNTHFVNAAACNLSYKPNNPPKYVELDTETKLAKNLY